MIHPWHDNGARLALAPLLLFALLFMPAAVAAKVKVFKSPKDSVTNYKTYQWEPTRVVTKQGIVDDHPEVSPMVRAALRSELAKKGYVEVKEGADLLVLTMALNEATSQLEGFLLAYGFDAFWGYGVSAVSTISRVNNEGSLFVSLTNAETKESLWSGYATQAYGRPGTLNKTVGKATAKLMKKLPKTKR